LASPTPASCVLGEAVEVAEGSVRISIAEPLLS
jgi:hypothetical protein